MSTGFRPRPRGGRPARSAAWVSSDSSGTSSPAASQASATRMPGPPPLVSTATRRPGGRRAGRTARAATSNISSRVPARITPAWWNSASTAWSRRRPARRCARTPPAARRRYRPALTDHDGLVQGDPPGDPGEPAGIGHRLQVGQDDVGAGVLVPVQQQVVRRQVGGVAHRHEAADAERGAGEQGQRGQPEPAGLGHERQPPRRGEGRAEGRVEPGLGPAVEQPHAVRPDEPHPGGPGAADAARPAVRGLARRSRRTRPRSRRPPARPGAPAWSTTPATAGAGHRHDGQVRRARGRRPGRGRRSSPG